MPLWSFSDVLPGTEPEPGQTGALAARPASGSPATDMVDDPGPVSDGAVAGFAFAAAPVDFRALAHLKWAPRQQPERAVEVAMAPYVSAGASRLIPCASTKGQLFARRRRKFWKIGSETVEF